MTTVPVIAGRAVAGVMVCTPLPGMANSIRSDPALPLASRMACRSEPAPESLVLRTVKAVAPAGAARANATSEQRALRRDGGTKDRELGIVHPPGVSQGYLRFGARGLSGRPRGRFPLDL